MKKNGFNSAIHDLKLQILASMHARCGPKWRTQDLATPFCRLYLPESGGGFLRVDGETVPMVPGFAYLLPPELPISYGCPELLVLRAFHLELMTPDHFSLFRGVDRILWTPVSREMLEALIELHQSQSYYSCLKLKQLVYTILVELYGQLPQGAETVVTHSEHVRDTVNHIHSYLSAQLTVEELAERRKISHTTLNNHFRRELGTTVGKYIDEQLMNRARELLCHSGLSLAQISAQLGFSDQFYFSNKFKAFSGLSPSQYRRNHGQEN